MSVVKARVNSAEIGRVKDSAKTGDERDSGRIDWDGKTESEGVKEGMGLDLEVQCLKGKQDSLKTTSLETKQVLEAKS